MFRKILYGLCWSVCSAGMMLILLILLGGVMGITKILSEPTEMLVTGRLLSFVASVVVIAAFVFGYRRTAPRPLRRKDDRASSPRADG